jgi:RNA polymerase sigma factor (TIGR02999 family)
MAESEDITDLLAAVRAGEEGSFDRLFEVVYDDLKRRAHHQIGGAAQTLDTTALVHEAYVKLAGASRPEWEDRTHFLRVAARAMRQILIDRARHHLTRKRGGGVVPLSLDDDHVGMPSPDTAAETLMALDEALSRLAGQSPRLAQVVELRFFGGLSVRETALALGVADRTVKRDWRLARAYLQAALSPHGPSS